LANFDYFPRAVIATWQSPTYCSMSDREILATVTALGDKPLWTGAVAGGGNTVFGNFNSN